MSDDFDGFISLDEAESLAIGTGQHRGTTVEFSNDGTTWNEVWLPDEQHTHPVLAQATVLRKLADGDVVSTRVTVRWDEYVPDVDSDRRANWDRMPTVMLGKVAKVSAYRGGYRDVIGNRFEPAELDQARRATRGPLLATHATDDWPARIAAVDTIAAAVELHGEIKSRRELTETLDVMLRQRMNALEDEAPKPGPPKPGKR